MSKRSIFYFFIICFLFLSSCAKEEIVNQDGSFIFGIYFGFCVDNCAHIYKYEDERVFPDIIDRFALDALIFSDDPDPDLVSTAKELADNFPSALLNSDQEIYGCPDCADQGTIFLQREANGQVRSWFIDTRIQDDWPEELKEYHMLLKLKIDGLIR